MRKRVVLAAVALALGGCAQPSDEAASPSPSPTAEAEAHWTYSGDTGPDRWGELNEEFKACGEGKQQSPIDIVEVEPDGHELGFSYKGSSGTVINTGHTIQVKPTAGGSITVDDRDYDLVQYHFHAPAEHTLEGARSALEAHFVHSDDDGKLAVVGVFIEEGEPNASFEPFWSDLPSEENEARDLAAKVDAGDLLPADRKAIYLYDGSLTTPPCTEGVQWIVLPETIEMSDEQIEAFRKLYRDNARPVQPQGEREIVEGEVVE